MGITLTSAVLMTMGSLTVIPLTYIADSLYNDHSVSELAIVGALLIAVGFILMESPNCNTLWQNYSNNKVTKENKNFDD